MQAQYAPSVRWEWISEAWNLFTRQWTAWVLMIFLMFLIVIMVEMVIYVPFAAMMVSMAYDLGRWRFSSSSGIPVLVIFDLPVDLFGDPQRYVMAIGWLIQRRFQASARRADFRRRSFFRGAVFRAHSGGGVIDFNRRLYRTFSFRHPGIDCLRTCFPNDSNDRRGGQGHN